MISLASPLAGRFVNDAPEMAGNAPLSLLDDTVPNLASAIVPVRLVAGNAPLKLVADNVFVDVL